MTDSPTEADKTPTTTTAALPTEGNVEEARPPAPSHTSVAPDGGWGWVVVVASFFMQALALGITFTFGVIYPELLKDFKESESTTAWVGSIQCSVLYGTGILGAPLIKLIGCRQVALLGAALSSTGFAVSAAAQNVFVLYLTYGVIAGIGTGLMFVSCTVITLEYFDKRRSLANGISMTGSGVGILFFGFVTNLLLQKLHWRWTMVVEGGMMSLGGLCALAYRPLPKNLPENSGEQGARAEPAAVPSNCHAFWSSLVDLSLLRCPPFVLICITATTFAFGYHVPYAYTPKRASKMFHIDAKWADLLISIMGVANVVCRPLIGLAVNRSAVLRFYSLITFMILCGLLSLYVYFMTTYALLVVYSVLFGIFGGCWATLLFVVVVDMMGVAVVEKAIGLCLASLAIGFLIASPIAGALIAATHEDYDVPFMFVGGLQVVSGFILLLARAFHWPGATVRPQTAAEPDSLVPHHRNSSVSVDSQSTDKEKLHIPSTSRPVKSSSLTDDRVSSARPRKKKNSVDGRPTETTAVRPVESTMDSSPRQLAELEQYDDRSDEYVPIGAVRKSMLTVFSDGLILQRETDSLSELMTQSARDSVLITDLDSWRQRHPEPIDRHESCPAKSRKRSVVGSVSESSADRLREIVVTPVVSSSRQLHPEQQEEVLIPDKAAETSVINAADSLASAPPLNAEQNKPDERTTYGAARNSLEVSTIDSSSHSVRPKKRQLKQEMQNKSKFSNKNKRRSVSAAVPDTQSTTAAKTSPPGQKKRRNSRRSSADSGRKSHN